MFKLVKSIIIKNQYILLLAFLAMFAAEDIFIFQRPFLFLLFFSCIPAQFLPYLEIASASDFVAASPRYNAFQRKKYALSVFLLTLIPYSLIIGIDLLIERYFLGTAAADFSYPFFLGAMLGAMVISLSFMYKLPRAASIILTTALCFIIGLFYNMHELAFMKILSKNGPKSLIIGFFILIVSDIISLILHNIFLNRPVTMNNYFVSRYYKSLNQIS